MAEGDLLLDDSGNILLDAGGNRLLAAAASCCYYQLYTCPTPGTSVDKWVSAATYSPGDVLSDDSGTTWYHIPVGAVASLCPGTIVSVTEGTTEDCDPAEEYTCEPCEFFNDNDPEFVPFKCCYSTAQTITWDTKPTLTTTTHPNTVSTFNAMSNVLDQYDGVDGWYTESGVYTDATYLSGYDLKLRIAVGCTGGGGASGLQLIVRVMRRLTGSGDPWSSSRNLIEAVVQFFNGDCCNLSWSTWYDQSDDPDFLNGVDQMAATTATVTDNKCCGEIVVDVWTCTPIETDNCPDHLECDELLI
jgi:hypothetical protein